MFRSRLVIAFFALASLVLAAVGCGSSAGSDSESGSSEPTKAEFIKTADAICERTDRSQKAAQRAFAEKYPNADSSTPWEEKFVVEVGLPPVQTLAEDLDELAAPKGDEETIEAIVEGMEDAVDVGLAEPSKLLKKGSAGPFTEVFELAREYGFKACATPL